MKELKEENNITLKIKDFIVSITHNDVGFNIDIFKNDTLLIEEQHWFDDLESSYKYELGL